MVLVPLSLWAFYILEDWSFKSIVLNKTKTFLKITVLLCELLVYGVYGIFRYFFEKIMFLICVQLYFIKKSISQEVSQ